MFIQINNLTKSFKLFKRNAGLKGAIKSFFNREYEYFTALDNINLNISEGEIIGVLGENPGTGWNVAGTPNATADHTITRKVVVTGGNPNWDISAGTNVDDSEWEVHPMDTFDFLGFMVHCIFVLRN